MNYKGLNYAGTFEYFKSIAIGWGFTEDDANNRAVYCIRNQATCYNNSIRKELINKDSECKICGKKESLQLDHIVESARGGKNELSNIQILCQRCNVNKNKEYFKKKKEFKIKQ